MLDDTPLTPDWWLLRLGNKLRERQRNLDLWWDYYRGEHPLPQGPEGAVEAYRDFVKKARTNFCATVVDASVHRLLVTGFTDPDGKPDEEAWGWWQRNRLDAKQKQVYRAALRASAAYVMVGPHPADPSRPLITPEVPDQVITENDPETGETRAALKTWYDDVDKVTRATVYLPDVIVRYQRAGRAVAWGRSSWDQRSDPTEHNLGAPPVVEFPCRPELGQDPEPEFGKVMDIQQRINLGVLNRMTAERYSAFRQKYVTGHKFKKTRDPETGLETVEQPFRPGPNKVWASEGENTRFGEFSQTDLMGYLHTHRSDIGNLLVVSQTPPWVVPGDLVNIATDTVYALGEMHVAKCEEHQAHFGEAWETVLALAARVAGIERDMSASEVAWRDPRKLNPAVVADMGSKRRAMGYPLAMVAEDMGDSPQRVKRLRSEAAAEQLTLSLSQPTAPNVTQLPAARSNVGE